MLLGVVVWGLCLCRKDPGETERTRQKVVSCNKSIDVWYRVNIITMVIRPLDDRTYCARSAVTHLGLWRKPYVCSWHHITVSQCVRRQGSLSSFITKWGIRIPRGRFDVESPNFTWTFTPVWSTITPDMTSLTTSGLQLSKLKKRLKMPPPTASLSYLYIENRLSKNHQILQASIPTCPTLSLDITSLLTSGRNQLQRKKTSKMHPQAASGGILRERFKRGSPNFTRFSRTTGPTNLPDMTSLVASGRLQNAIK